MLELKALHANDMAKVSRLSVSKEQLPFVGTIEEILSSKSDDCDCHLVTSNNDVMGFLIADTTYHQRYDFAKEDEVGVRGFFIDEKHQGKGYGKAAVTLLGNHFRLTYPTRSSIVLTVNCKNSAAYNCYQGAGFKDNGDLYLGGTAGPQNIMRLKL
jgi:RimJ/RimL family protein N-acetyltransferase